MPTPELQRYIREQKKAGASDEQIRQTLAGQGWQKADLEQAFGISSANSAVPLAPANPADRRTMKIIITIAVILIILAGASFAATRFIKDGVREATPELGGFSYKNNEPKPEAFEGSVVFSDKIPGNWPKDVPIYPDTKVLHAANLSVLKGGDSGIVLNLESSDLPEIVRGYYRNQLSVLGWNITFDDVLSLAADKNGKTVNIVTMPKESDSKGYGSIITVVLSDKPLYGSDYGSNDYANSGFSQNPPNQNPSDCGFKIIQPAGWVATGGEIFRNSALSSEIKLSCKQNGFENNYYVLTPVAQEMMTKPDSGFYVTTAKETTVGSRRAYLFREEHKSGGMKYYEQVLMIDSGVKNGDKNDVDIIYAIIPAEHKAAYEALISEAMYSYAKQ